MDFASTVEENKRAPGAPGIMGTWTRPDKDGVATTLNTKVWFTIANGVVTEIHYPFVDRLQTRDSFLMIKRNGKVYDERHSFEHKTTRREHTLAYDVVSNRVDGLKIKKLVQVSPRESAVVFDYEIQNPGGDEIELVLTHNVTSEGTSGGDAMLVYRGYMDSPMLVGYQADIRGDEPEAFKQTYLQAMAWDIPNSDATVGILGASSPEDLIKNKTWGSNSYDSAGMGNVEGALIYKTSRKSIKFRAAILFEKRFVKVKSVEETLTEILKTPSSNLVKIQKNEWLSYLEGLNFNKKDRLEEISIMVLKALEDKTFRGALIAAPAIPSIPWHLEAPEHSYENSRRRIGDSNAGYNRVWPRDLFHKALSFMAVGDYATAIDTAKWFRQIQFSDWRDGSFSQNMFVDGTPSWQGYQIDQTGFPIALIGRLVELNLIDYADYRDMVIRAADFIVRHGPGTDQERWEENGGLSLNSLSAAIEGLKSAAWLEAGHNKMKQASRYDATANEWMSKYKEWTLIPNGFYGQNYFARMEVAHEGKWDPTRHGQLYIQNKRHDQKNLFTEDEILDGGFLQFITLGLVDPLDKDFAHTINIYDQHVMKKTKYGAGYYRYNYDSYGENHLGGIWPLLSAERAIVGIERNENIQQHVDLMRNMSTESGMIGEQDTIAVRPLGWSHASYLLLMRSIRDNRSYYIPLRSK